MRKALSTENEDIMILQESATLTNNEEEMTYKTFFRLQGCVVLWVLWDEQKGSSLEMWRGILMRFGLSFHSLVLCELQFQRLFVPILRC